MSRDPNLAFWTAFFPSAFSEGRHFFPGPRRFHHPEGLDAQTVREWIRRNTKAFKLNTTQWARLAALAPSTLNRFVKSEGPENLSANSISALANALNEFLDQAPTPIREQMLPPKSEPEFSIEKAIRHAWTVPVMGSIDSHPKKIFEWDPANDFKVQIPVPLSQIPNIIGFQIGDDKYSSYTKGDIIVCSPAKSSIDEFEDGQIFMLHARNHNDEVVTSLKRGRKDPDGGRWLTRMPDQADGTRSIFMEDFGDETYTSDMLLSFKVVTSIRAEPWVRTYNTLRSRGSD